MSTRIHDDGAGARSAAEGVPEHVRTSCAVGSDQQESTDSLEISARRWERVELMLEAIRLATPLDAEERTPDDLLLVLAFRRSFNLVFHVDQTIAEDHLLGICRILHIRRLADGTMLGNDAAGQDLAEPQRGAGG
jgi:hypothetical protein